MIAKKRKNNKKWLKWVGFLVLAIVVAVGAFLVWNAFSGNKGEEPGVDQGTTGEVQESDMSKKSETESAPEREATEKKKIVQYEGADPNEEAAATGVLTGALTHASVDGGQLVVRVNIDQSLGSGTCTLALKQGGAVVRTEVAPVIMTAATASCEGFDVDISGLSGGETEIVINVESDDKAGEIRGSVVL